MIVSFALTRIATVAAMAAAAYGIAVTAVPRLRLLARAERTVLGTALGLGIMGTLFLFAGLLGVLTRAAVLAVTCVGLVATLFRTLRRQPQTPTPPGGGRLAGLLTAGLATGSLWILGTRALFPPTAFDATMYHLPMAKAYAASARVAPLPDLRFPVFPALNEVLFAGAMLLRDDVAAQCLELVFFVLVTAGLWTWSARTAGVAEAPAWAVALWLSSPIVYWLAPVAYVDMCLAAFAFFSTYAFSCWLRTRDVWWLGLAGAFAGFAAATKYSGLLFIGVGVLATALGAARGLRARALVICLGFSAATGAWWYALNAYWGKSPVWPFLGGVFGYRFWTRGDLQSLRWSLRQPGWGRSAGALAALPFHLVFDQPHSEPRVGVLLLLLFPLALWASLRHEEPRGPSLVIVAFLLFWFATTQQIRFLIPAVPLLAFVDATALATVVQSCSGRWRRVLKVGLTAGLVALACVVQAYEWSRNRGLSVPTTAAEREQCLGVLPSYGFYRDLNRRLGSAYTVYAFHDESMRYYCDGRQLGDWFGPGRYADAPLGSGQALFEWLQKLGATHLLVNRSQMPSSLPSDSFFQTHFVPVFENGPYAGFSLRP